MNPVAYFGTLGWCASWTLGAIAIACNQPAADSDVMSVPADQVEDDADAAAGRDVRDDDDGDRLEPAADDNDADSSEPEAPPRAPETGNDDASGEPEPTSSEPEPASFEPEPASSEPEAASSEPEPGNMEAQPDTGTQAVDAGPDALPPDALECPRDFGHVPFTLAFSVDWAKEASFEADCNVDAIDGPEPYVVRLACLAMEGDYYPQPDDFALDVEVNLLQGTPESLELGSSVRFRYSWLIGFNTENYAYSISATELTPGRTAGDPLLGGVHGDEWSYVVRVFDPVGLTLSDATCTNEPTPDWEDFDCIRSTLHDLVFSFQGQSVRVPVPETATLPTSPQLAVSANSAFVQVTVDQCCFDCEDDLIIASYWALAP